MSSEAKELPDLSERPSSPALSCASPTRTSQGLSYASARNPYQPMLPGSFARRPLVRKPLSALSEEEKKNLKRTERPPMDLLDGEDASSVLDTNEATDRAHKAEFVVGQRNDSKKIHIKKRVQEVVTAEQDDVDMTRLSLARFEVRDQAEEAKSPEQKVPGAEQFVPPEMGEIAKPRPQY
ncbi:hypothetical protein OIV83_003247 [Microbotryomycetes sp. JL201]|nr:hypothetical protein OIV83_003247 [Microbotryomycetes sp. JL201]